MNSVNARILAIDGRLITVSVPHSVVADLAGKRAKLNGFGAVWLNSPPSKEADDDETELTDALAYRVEGKDNLGSLAVASICEVTWM
jgi:hypothetical protein